jgi:hypothetical protein
MKGKTMKEIKQIAQRTSQDGKTTVRLSRTCGRGRPTYFVTVIMDGTRVSDKSFTLTRLADECYRNSGVPMMVDLPVTNEGGKFTLTFKGRNACPLPSLQCRIFQVNGDTEAALTAIKSKGCDATLSQIKGQIRVYGRKFI